jgi:hypothetical protein
MRRGVILLVLIVTTPALSDEPASQSRSRFHLLSTKCEAEADEPLDATPQSPPLEVDDPSTPGCNRWEINIVVGSDITRTQASWELPLLDVNYGIGDNIQLKYELPFLLNQTQGTSAAAIGESLAGIKWMFFEDEQTETQIAIYPQVSFVQANADVITQGLASPGSIVTLPILLSRPVGHTPLGPIDITADLGYNFSTKPDTADFVSASIGIGTPVLNKLVVMGELTTEQAIATISDEGRSQLVRTDLGAMTMVSKRLMLFGAVGRSWVASDSLDHTYALAGIRLLTGGSAPRVESVAAR